jgi:hypothetical protein
MGVSSKSDRLLESFSAKQGVPLKRICLSLNPIRWTKGDVVDLLTY